MPPGQRRDDKYFGPLAGSAQRAWDAMVKTYGRKDAEHIYHARIVKLKRRDKRR